MQLKQQLAAAVYLRIHRYYFCVYADIYVYRCTHLYNLHARTDIPIRMYCIYIYICTNMPNAHAQIRTHCTTTCMTNVHTLMWKEEQLKKKRANEKTLVHMVGELESEVYTCTHAYAHTCTHTYIHTYTISTHICISENMHMHMYTCTCTHAHTHTHTHTHTHVHIRMQH